MKNINTKFENFENEKLTTKQQKTVRGGDGDGETEPKSPGKSGGNGNG